LEFPLIFAGDSDNKGEERTWSAPGLDETNSENYFSYVFLWMIEEDPHLNTSKMEHILNSYFDGLVNTGAITNFNFFKQIPETASAMRRIDKNTFEGTIERYDEFFTKEAIILNPKIVNEYFELKQKYLVWFYLSPQEKNHPIWK